jgi:hypothetical protein
MPVQECNLEEKPGYQWGDGGKCYTYTPGDEESRKDAKRKAYVQGYAIGELSEMEIEEYQLNDLSELANILNVPVLTTGEFQGHKGPPVIVDEQKFQRLLEGSNRFRPFLKEALKTGIMPGNPDFFQRLHKPMPAPITFNHQVLEDDKIKESLKDVDVEFSTTLVADDEFPDGKPWIVERFSGVNPLAADIIQRFFTKRSVEIMELNDPETGERLPVIISTAFLDKSTPPAVPGQSDDLLVEFAGLDESHYVITTDEPLILQGVTNMAEKKQEQDKSVDVSELQQMQEALAARDQAFAELQAKVAKLEEERKKAIELANQEKAEKEEATKEVQELQAIRNEVKELRAKNDELDSDKLINHLLRFRKVNESTFQVSPAYQQIVEPIIRKNGVIELAEGESYRQAMENVFDEIAELASKDALLLPLTTQGKKPYSREDENKPKDFDEEVHELMQAEHLELGEAIERVTAQHRKAKEAQKEA